MENFELEGSADRSKEPSESLTDNSNKENSTYDESAFNLNDVPLPEAATKENTDSIADDDALTPDEGVNDTPPSQNTTVTNGEASNDAYNTDGDNIQKSLYSLPEAEELIDIFTPEDAFIKPVRENDDKDGEDIRECSEATEKQDKRARINVNGIFEFTELLIMTIAAVMLILSFVCRHSIVKGPSMQNTLQDGDHLIISDLFYKPKQFDIIVFEDRSTGVSEPMVKRVIALGGDTVKINELGEVRVNDVLLDEEYVFIDGGYSIRTVEYTVPEGKVYVMGDHRNESSDSRSYYAIDEDTILGKVVLRISPFDKFGPVD